MYIDLTKMTREEEVDYFITKIDDCETKAYDDVLRGKKRIYDIPFKYRDRRICARKRHRFSRLDNDQRTGKTFALFLYQWQKISAS